MKERHRALQALSLVVMIFAVTFAGGLFTGELLVDRQQALVDGKVDNETDEIGDVKEAEEVNLVEGLKKVMEGVSETGDGQPDATETIVAPIATVSTGSTVEE